MNDKELISKAFAAMERAYAPYSGYKVGAALLSENGTVYEGCNIENAAYGPTNCAERTAFFKAVSEGHRNFSKIAVVGGKNGEVTDYFSPCGVCRQVMVEFCDGDFEIVLAKSADEYSVFKLSELLPMSFTPNNIKN